MSEPKPEDVERRVRMALKLKEIDVYKTIAKELLTEASDCWRLRKDESAKRLRAVAEGYEKKAKELRAAFDKEFFPPVVPGPPRKPRSMGFGQGG